MKTEQNQKHPFPAFLSLLWPGLGQVIKGKIFSGLLTMVVFVFCILLMFSALIVNAREQYVLLVELFLWGIILMPFVIWLMSIYDAYNSNDESFNEFRKRRREMENSK